MRSLFFTGFIFLVLSSAFGQCPTASFTFSDDLCIEENVTLTNTSVDAVSYEWDFCLGDLLTTPTGQQILDATNFTFPEHIEIVEDGGMFYGFVPNRTGLNVLRLDFGTDLNTVPEVVDLGNVNDLFSQPYAISFYEESNVWYGMVVDHTSGGNGSLIRLTFGAGLGSAPTNAEDLGNPGNFLRAPTDIVIVEEGGDHYAFVANAFAFFLTRVDFGNSFTNNPSNSDATRIFVSHNPWGIDLYEECGNWYGVFSSPLIDRVDHLSFDGGLGSTPTITQITGTFSDPYGVDLVSEGVEKYAWVMGENGNYYRMSFGTSFSDTTPDVSDLGALGTVANPKGVAIASDSSSWYGFVIDANNKLLDRVSFVNGCVGDNFYSTEEVPTGISYGSSGDFRIGLTSIDSDGDRVTVEETITITTNTAPDISFDIDASRCIENTNTFTSTSTETITNYSWDFNGEGVSSLASPDFQFPTSGEKTVMLEVTGSSGCTNAISEVITVYDSPPVPDFDFSGAECVANEITFSNTTLDSDWSDVISYDWSFGTEGVSTDRDPTFTFSDPGLKTVSVTSSIPGCTSDAYEEVITIQDGPTPSFTFTGNCGVGSVISFTDDSGETDVAYSWDFGDGNMSTDQHPTHSYATAGSYTVTFTQTNTAGSLCSAFTTSEIVVSDASKASFTSSGLETNLNSDFTGVDETGTEDAVTSWSWDFDNDDVADANTQLASFTFTSAGDFTVSLTITTSQGCEEEITEVVTVTTPDCPTASFTFTDDLCIEENVTLTNTSVNAVSYEWDFCLGDLLTTPTGQQLLDATNFTFPEHIEIVEDGGMFYGFVPNRTGLNVLRLDFGTDLNTVPEVVDLGNVNDLFTQPYAISFYEESDVWYGMVVDHTSGGNGSLIRLTFGSGLGSSPTGAEDLGNPGNFLRAPTDIVLAEEGGNYYAFVTNASSFFLTRIDFGDSFTNNPSSSDATRLFVSHNPWGIDLYEECGSWYGVFTSPLIDRVDHLDFAGGLGADPTITEINSTFSAPYGVDLVSEGSEKYAWVIGENSNYYRMSFGTSFSDTNPDVSDLGSLGTVSSPKGLSIASDSSTWHGFVIDADNKLLDRISFVNGCTGDNFYSGEEVPEGISYGNSGDFNIGLTVIDSDGDRVTVEETITITTNTAPDISFDIDASRCIENTNTFTSTSTETITSYSWDFNGEGNGFSANETFGFSATGQKIVTLTVDNGTCINTVSKSITIYPEPPDPSFSFSSSEYCEDTDFQLVNNTDDAAFEGDLSYSWIVPESGQNFDGNNPTFNISQSGSISVEAQSSIPGCVSGTISQSLIILDSPTSDFSGSLTCEGETTIFENLSEGATTYLWDFGNDFTSTQTTPEIIYEEAGEYEISLAATNSSGCTTVKAETFKVEANPVAGFQLSLPCEAQVTLTDTSTVDNSSLASWEWYVDGDLLSTGSIPELPIDEPGTYQITAVVRSDAGCRDEATSEIEVLDAAEVDFSIEATCDGTPFSIGDNSLVSESNQIIARTWDINGTFYEDSSFLHDFEGPGDYPIRLVVTTENLCTATIEDTITVLTAPELAFELDEVCQNTLVSIDDNTLAFDDTIASRSWLVNDQLLGNGDSFIHMFTESGKNELTLTVSTASGCEYVLSKDVDVLEASQASFESNTSFGGPGTEITFNDLSANSDSSIWFINNEQINGGEDLIRVFADPGTYEVSLLSFSSMECADTTSMEVIIREPEVDLIIQEIVLVEQDDDFSSVLISVLNQSNLPVDNLRFTIQVEDQLPTQDRINQFIGIGESRVIELDAGVPNLAEYLCVQVASPYESDDISPGDNEICLNVEPEVIIEPPFPNPARDQTTVRTIIPVEGDVTVSLLNVSGKVEVSETFQDLAAGLHSFPVILAPYEAGMYFLKIEYAGITEIIRIIKQ